MLGQIAMGFVPVAGQAADVRDFAASWEKWRAGEAGGGIGVFAATIGFVPGVGDAAKAAIRGGSKAAGEVAQEATEALSKEAVELAQATAALANRKGEFIGSGSFADVYRDGDNVVKEIRPTVGKGAESYNLPEASRAELAELQAEFVNDLASVDGMEIPNLSVSAPGELTQAFVEGGIPLPDLAKVDFDAYERATAVMEAALGKARRHFDLSSGESGVLEGGWRVQIDEQAENFHFNEQGELLAWIDPIAIWPPKELLANK